MKRQSFILLLVLAMLSPIQVLAIPGTAAPTLIDVVGCQGIYKIDGETFQVDCPNNSVTISSLTVTGSISIAGGITVSSTTINGLQVLGSTDTLGIELSVCSTGQGRCVWYSIDTGDQYISTGTLAGQFRNSRTGTGP